MRLLHYYHVYCDEDDNWTECVEQHCAALLMSGLAEEIEGPVCVGVVGDRLNRLRVAEWFRAMCVPAVVLSSVYTTWEQRTLEPLWQRSQLDSTGAVLYAHTKGAAHPSIRQDQWRHDMTWHLVHGWKSCRDMLDEGMDVVGPYRIVNDGEAKAAFGDGADIVAAQLNRDTGAQLDVTPVFPEQGQAIFAGNFWWARMEWIASLSRPGTASRYDAETWVGNPNAEGWHPWLYNIAEWLKRTPS